MEFLFNQSGLHGVQCDVVLFTPPKFNMEPENDGFQKESAFPGVDFQVNHVKLQGCTLSFQQIPKVAAVGIHVTTSGGTQK